MVDPQWFVAADTRCLTLGPPMMSWLGAVLGVAGALSRLFTGASSQRSQARVAEARLNAEQDRLAMERAAQEQDNARQNLTANTNYTSAQQDSAKRNALLEGLQDATIERPAGIPTFSVKGGLRPSAIAGGSAMGKQFKEDALAKLLAGTPSLNTSTPELTPTPKAGKLDKFLNIAGGITGLVGLGNSLYQGAKGGSPSSFAIPQGNPMDLINTTPKVSGGLDDADIPGSVANLARRGFTSNAFRNVNLGAR